MKFGVHHLVSCPEGLSPQKAFQDALDEAVLAEGLGFESAWPVEQHSDQSLSALPCPALMLAAIAARTTTLRLGTAIVQAPLTHPFRLAEEIATLDVLSKGRVELGIGRGANPRHYTNLGIPVAEGRERMAETLDYIKRAFTLDRFSFEGKYFRATDACLVPKSVQRPHPPIRLAANGPETLAFAGERGYPILVAAHLNPIPTLSKLVAAYGVARVTGGQPSSVPDDLSILIPMFIAKSEPEVRRWAEPAVRAHVQHLSSNLSAVASQLSDEAARKRLESGLATIRATTYEQMRDSMAIFATPAACRDRLKDLQKRLNPGRLICWFNFMGTTPHDETLNSMKLFSSQVMPHFAT